jgi:hypothetical protein
MIWLRSEYAKKTNLQTPDLQILVMASLFKAHLRTCYDVKNEVIDDLNIQVQKNNSVPITVTEVA